MKFAPYQLCLCNGNVLLSFIMSLIMLNCGLLSFIITLKNSKFCIMNNTERQRSQFCVKNDTVNDKKGHDIVNDSFAHKPDGLHFDVCCNIFGDVTEMHRYCVVALQKIGYTTYLKLQMWCGSSKLLDSIVCHH